jgi:hypothetical protein
MSELTPEQHQAVVAAEFELIAASIDIAGICDGTGALTWNLASTLVGRDIDALTVGELRKLVREAAR